MTGLDAVRSSQELYICDWLPPDFGAVGQYALLHCRERAATGVTVTLVGLTSGESREEVEQYGDGSLRIVRLRASPTPRDQWLRRLLWALWQDVRLVRAAARNVASACTVIFTGAPPFMLPFVLVANLRWRRHLVYRMTDFWPECAIAALGREPPGWRMIQRVFVAMRRRVHVIEVLGQDQKRRLLEQGIPESQIRIRRDPSPVSIPPETRPLPRPVELEGHRILLYSGNWGVAHDVDTFVAGYVRHHRKGTGTFALWLNATGAGADEVEGRLKAAGVPVLRTCPVPLEQLPRLLVTVDAHLITLKDAFVGYVLPSKVYACLESGRPILFIGSEKSDVHLLCRERYGDGRYRRVPVGDVEGVVEALERMAVSVRSTGALT